MDRLFDPQLHSYLIGFFFIIAGILHFIKPKFYIRIMPDYIPYHRTMVLISGLLEILGGVGFLIPALRIYAIWGLILLLLAIFPSNIDMAWKGYKNYGFTVYTLILIARLPLQFLLIFWIYWAGLAQ